MKTLTHFAALCCLCSFAQSQDLEEGYATQIHSLPPGAGQVLTLPDLAARVYFDGNALVLDEGGVLRTLLSFPSFTFGSFTIRRNSDSLLFGESSTGGIWIVPIAIGVSPQRIAELTFNFDAIMLGADSALVSAKTGGFGASDNEVFAVNLSTGVTDLILQISGASGPVLGTGDGGFFYATSSNVFPTTPGATDILRFSAAQVAGARGPGHLTLVDGEVIFSGLDAAGDLAMDGDGDLFVVDWFNAELVEISIGSQGVIRRSSLISYGFAGGPTANSLQYIPGADRPRSRFEPFQPHGRGGRLLVHESEFGGDSQVREVLPARPTMSTNPSGTIPTGPFTISIDGGPALGHGILAIGFDFFDIEIPVHLPSFEQPLFWQLGMFLPLFAREIDFDQNGHASLDLVHPGFVVPLRLSSQVAFLSFDGVIAGTSVSVDFVLR